MTTNFTYQYRITVLEDRSEVLVLHGSGKKTSRVGPQRLCATLRPVH